MKAQIAAKLQQYGKLKPLALVTMLSEDRGTASAVRRTIREMIDMGELRVTLDWRLALPCPQRVRDASPKSGSRR